MHHVPLGTCSVVVSCKKLKIVITNSLFTGDYYLNKESNTRAER